MLDVVLIDPHRIPLAPDASRDLASAPFRPDPDRPGEVREAERLVADDLARLLPGGVLVGAHVPDTTLLRAGALRLALTPRGRTGPGGPAARAVVGFRTAAWLHTGGRAPRDVDLVVAPSTARPKGVPVRLHEHRLHPDEVQVIGGLRVTTPVRTAADLARRLPAMEVGPALDRLRVACGVNLVEVIEQLDRMPHARGVVGARTVIHAWAGALASLSPPIVDPGPTRLRPGSPSR